MDRLVQLLAAVGGKAREEWLRHRLLKRYWRDPRVAPRLRAVMSLSAADVGRDISTEAPRSLPGNPEFVKSGWSQHMLLRYLLPLESAQGARVLDTCSGLGWGAHVVRSVAPEVVGVDLDQESVAFSNRRWAEDGLKFVLGSVLELPFPDSTFDLVLCMESIEHFGQADGERYLAELARVCRPGGALFGSTALPETRAAADRLCRRNPHHLYVYTRRELDALLRRKFGSPTYLTRHYFAAKSR